MHIGRKFLALAFIVMAGCFARAQTYGPFVITATSSPCASVDTGTTNSTVWIKVSGTFSMTLQPSAAIAGQTADNVQVVPSTSTTPQSTITAAGAYKAGIAGSSLFQVCASAYVSGTATIYLKLSSGVSAALLGGGSGGTIASGSTGQAAVYTGATTLGSAQLTLSSTQFAASTSANLLGILSDATGTGFLVGSGSPALTGTPTVPTAAAATNTTQAASTAFVESEIPLRSAVTSVFTRTGAVVAATSDYTAAQVTNAMATNAVNTGTTAVTMDLSASTVANAFKVPIGAGLTSGADGVIAYDTTNANTHIRVNSADALAAGEAAAVTSGAVLKSSNSTKALIVSSSITDNAVKVSTAEPIQAGTAGGTPGFTDITIGYNTAAMTAQSTATCTNVTGMTWTIAANKRYVLSCRVPRTLAASATLQYCLGGPGTATSYMIDVQGLNGASSAWSDVSLTAQTAYGGKTTASSANANTSVDFVTANIQNGSTASGTALTLQTAGNGTNNITVGADASCVLTQAN